MLRNPSPPNLTGRDVWNLQAGSLPLKRMFVMLLTIDLSIIIIIGNKSGGKKTGGSLEDIEKFWNGKGVSEERDVAHHELRCVVVTHP